MTAKNCSVCNGVGSFESSEPYMMMQRPKCRTCNGTGLDPKTVPKDCKVNPISSAICNKGTKSCYVNHKDINNIYFCLTRHEEKGLFGGILVSHYVVVAPDEKSAEEQVTEKIMNKPRSKKIYWIKLRKINIEAPHVYDSQFIRGNS